MTQIREEQKELKRLDLLEGFGINFQKLKQLVGDGVLPSSLLSGKFYPAELVNSIQNWNGIDSINRYVEDHEYWNALKICLLQKVHDGIFLIDPESDEPIEDGFLSMIRTYGVWKAQGLNNHVHMPDITSNKISQILLAYELIDLWHNLLTKLNMSDKCVIYMNGRRDTVICIYFIGGVKENILKRFDAELKIKHIIIYNK